MLPLVSFLTTALLALHIGANNAISVYDPYMDAADLYRMQLLSNAFEYPGDKVDMGGLGGGALDAPYGYINDAGNRLVDIDDSEPSYWPEALVAELAAAAENERAESEGVAPDAGIRIPEDHIDASEIAAVAANADLDEAAKDESKLEKVEQELQKEKTKYSSAQIRDQEHLEHSALHGYQSVSGGTVDGQSKQTKTDKALPAYCNPPNPCPVGKTAEDNCVENFENSAENNQRLLSEQECPCDTEHMFTCPEGSKTVSSKAQGPSSNSEGSEPSSADQMQINKAIAELSGMDEAVESMATRKRVTLIAKKSPHMIKKRADAFEPNPYLEGQKIKIAAKKDPNISKRVIHEWELQ